MGLEDNVDNFDNEMIVYDYHEAFTELQLSLTRLLDNSEIFIQPMNSEIVLLHRSIKNYKNFLNHDIADFFENNPKYILRKVDGLNIIDQMRNISSHLPESIDIASEKELDRIKVLLQDLQLLYRRLYAIYQEDISKDKYLEELREELAKAKESVKQVEAAKLALEGLRTEEIYSGAYDMFKREALIYERWFYGSFILIVSLGVASTFLYPYEYKTMVDFIVRKLLFITLGLTLCTYFLRKSSHAKKQYDQAHQTSLELKALPLFIRGLPDTEQHIIIKDLAAKYFGKTVDQTQNDKIGDLMHDQIKAGTELIRASADMVKGVKSTASNEPEATTGDKPT